MNTKIYLIILLSISMIFTGCSQQQQQQQQQHVTIAGSGSGVVILKLVEKSFEEKYPNVDIQFLSTTGTGDGIKGVGEGLIEVGSAARKMKNSEKVSYPDLIEYTYVKDAMILAVNENVNISGLTTEQISKIFSGEIENWNQVGGNDGKILLLDREESESSKILIREYIIRDIKVTDDAVLINDAVTMDEAIISTENTFGQTSYGVVKMNEYPIKPIAVDGVIPSVETVKDGTYELVREYGIVISKNSPYYVQEFVDYLFSEDAKQIFEKNSFVPVPKFEQE